MVEVFKTNVKNWEQANLLITHIQETFTNYKVNFDLEDCDNILRIACTTGYIQASQVIILVKNFGFEAEVLPDEIPVWRATFASDNLLKVTDYTPLG